MRPRKSQPNVMWSGPIFSDKIVTNSGVWGTWKSRAIFPTKIIIIKIVGSGGTLSYNNVFRTLFGQSLSNDKNEIKAKLNAFSFCLIFSLEELIRVQCMISISKGLNRKSMKVMSPLKIRAPIRE